MTKAAKKIEPMKAITIKANELEAIALAASHEDTRYYLNGVCVEVYKDGSYGMIATDGHRMASLHARQKEEAITSFIIGNDTIKKALTLYKMAAKTVAKSVRDRLVLIIDEKTVDIVLEDITKDSFNYAPVDADFPDWRRIIPSEILKADTMDLAFNTDYIADFGKMAKLLRDSKIGHIQIISNGNQNPITVNIAYDGFIGVLIPVRL